METNKSDADNQPVPIGILAVNDADPSEHLDSDVPVPIAIYQTKEFLDSSKYTGNPNGSSSGHNSSNSPAEDLALSDHHDFHSSELDSDLSSSDLSWVKFCKPLLRKGIPDHISKTSDLTKEIQSRNFPATQPLIHDSSLEVDAPNKSAFEPSQFYPSKEDPTGMFCWIKPCHFQPKLLF